MCASGNNRANITLELTNYIFPMHFRVDSQSTKNTNLAQMQRFIQIVFVLCCCVGFVQTMQIGERLSYSYRNSKYGKEFRTTYQHFPGAKKSTNPFRRAETKPSVVFIHGFGGNADQFRKNAPLLANSGYDAYSIDLLGFGYSDKPNPKEYGVNALYNFETWGEQAEKFVRDVVKGPTVLVCNSIGGVVGLQASLSDTKSLVKEVVLIDVSLRLLHVTKQNPIQRTVVPIIQSFLRETAAGAYFFKQVATPNALRNILNSAYAFPGKGARGVDDEIIDLILQPGLSPGAAEVFLDFISYSSGPLPEDLLPLMQKPVTILWGEHDPWEPLDLAKKTLSDFSCVQDFIVLPGGGHCPMDQVPDDINRELLRILTRPV